MKLNEINNNPIILVPDHEDESKRSRAKIDPRALVAKLRRKADKQQPVPYKGTRSSFIDWLGSDLPWSKGRQDEQPRNSKPNLGPKVRYY